MEPGVKESSMHWTEQAEAVAKSFSEAQKRIWDTWCESMRSTPVPPFMFPGAMEQWREWSAQFVKSWTPDTQQIVKDVTWRLADAQYGAMHFLELWTNIWKAMAPKIDAGEDWQTVLMRQTEQLRQRYLDSPKNWQQTLQDTGELWRLYLEECNKLGQPWAESVRRASWHFGHAASGDGSELIKLSSLYWDAYERTFGRLLESPSLGHTRELNEDLIKGFHAWLEFRRASFEYQVMLAETAARACEQFMVKLIALAEKREPVKNLKELLFLWIDVVDQVFVETFRSEKYARMQGHLVNTAMAYRLSEREITEAFLKVSHVPSRTEVDEAYRRIYELRKEVRELKKTLHEVKAALAATNKRTD